MIEIGKDNSKTKAIAAVIIVCFIILGIGYIVGYFGTSFISNLFQ